MLFIETNIEDNLMEQSSEIEDVKSYVRVLNRFGELIFSKKTPIELLKSLDKDIDWQIESKTSYFNDIQTLLQAGARKLIFPKDHVKETAQTMSKNIITAKIRLKDVSLESKEDLLLENLTIIIKELESFCSEFLLIDDLDGSIPWDQRLELYKSLLKITRHSLIVSLPKTDYGYAKLLEKLGINPLIRSDNRFEEEELINLFLQILDFEKSNGFIPTIVQDDNNQVLMLAYSTQETVKRALTRKKGVYFSRSRDEIWIKGETSGNFQELTKIRYDCDRDTLLCTVRQTGEACHLNRYSCFGKKHFGFSELLKVIKERIANPPPNSYTSKLVNDEKLLLEKIKEESREVVNFTDRENLIWEIADLSYFILVLMAIQEIEIQDIINELWRRRNNE
ncbi:MAG: bifunctional phosphoribosyl-AMP cyclohydrolase/phosphoribosyl-ATP diphosphatase HisIE [Candidatus Hodarchaeota archaeon]